jgi:hypothetical protein
MATNTNIANRPPGREWREFAFHGYAVIIARKHNLVVPTVELSVLSDEEFTQFFELVRDLAHLPPG